MQRPVSPRRPSGVAATFPNRGMIAALLWGLLFGFAPAARPAETPPLDAADAFEELQTLVGVWVPTEDDSELRVEFHLSAGGSVLVETWSLPSGWESLSLYHLDGERLLATHYCPAGNQPRLAYAGRGTDGALAFTLESITNLASPEATHQETFEIRIGKDALTRTDVYRSGGEPKPESLTLRRLAASPQGAREPGSPPRTGDSEPGEASADRD